MENLSAKIEAVLFAYGEPISIERLSKILKIDLTELEAALKDLETELSRQERGIVLIKNNGKIQLATKPELTSLLEDIIKQEFTEDLTQTALETLSIIAYAGPISRADIEYIRGVNSSFTIRNLLLRGLIERMTDPKRANAYIYTASFDLIKRLGILKVEDLPDYEKYKQMVKNLHEASLNPVQQKTDILIPEEQAPVEDHLSLPNDPGKESI
jgi:segregation and condensation protein B